MWNLLLLFIVPVFSYNKHISYSDLLKCKEFRGPNDYKYEQFFDITNFEHNKPASGEVFRLKFYVMSTRDVWMLLTPSTNLTGEAHEIGKFSIFFLKCSRNQNFLGIEHSSVVIQTPYYHFGDKRKRYFTDADSKHDPHPLYPLEIVIKYTYGGKLSVVLPEYSNSRPYVAHQYDSYTPCPYLSLSCGPSQGEARWFYDCPLGDNAVFVN